SLAQRLAIDQLHRAERDAVGGAELERARDVSMRHAAGELDLVPEPRERVGRREFGTDHLERDLLVELAVARAIHRAHPAGAEQREDVVAAGERPPGQVLAAHPSTVPP